MKPQNTKIVLFVSKFLISLLFLFSVGYVLVDKLHTEKYPIGSVIDKEVFWIAQEIVGRNILFYSVDKKTGEIARRYPTTLSDMQLENVVVLGEVDDDILVRIANEDATHRPAHLASYDTFAVSRKVLDHNKGILEIREERKKKVMRTIAKQ